MSQQRLFSTLLTVGLLASFAMGLGFPEVLAKGKQIAQGGCPKRMARSGSRAARRAIWSHSTPTIGHSVT